ncbi:MAG: sensor histidine kinase [Bacillota bacterium]|nr:sensor histidine kinase [Bacillota bacterium]
MATKSKSKYVFLLIFILCIYMLGTGLLFTLDFLKNYSYVKENPYFNSYNYKNEINVYFNNLAQLIIDYQNNNIKAADKKSSAAISSDIINLQDKNIYKDLKDSVSDNDSISYIDSMKSIKYYIKDKKSGKIYTNLNEPSNIDTYIKNSLHTESFPKDSISKEFNSINSFFQYNNLEVKFIILNDLQDYSQLRKDYKYYNSIHSRIIKESILGAVLLIISITAIRLFLNKVEYLKTTLNKITSIYDKIYLDFRIFLLLINIFIFKSFLNKLSIFYLPLEINHVIKLTIASIYIFYFIINIYSAANILNSTEIRLAQWKNCFVYQLLNIRKTDLKIKTLLKIIFLILLSTALFPIFVYLLIISIENNFSNAFLCILSAAYIFIYIIAIPIYILKKTNSFVKIINGTNQIVSGNLNYEIDENGGGVLSLLAGNINNMKDGYRKSAESQMKSERLKTELITNVSHDLKTPLTSIINYTALLKNISLSEDDKIKYIDVLDKKSQRLKTLIEDLFEISKMTSGVMKLNIQKIDICSLLRQAIGESDDKISSSSLIFKVTIPVSPIYLNLDGKKTWRVFENLINNALKYSQPNSRVYIDLVEYDNIVTIIIKNVSSYEMDFDTEEIFERFKRGDKARSTEGSGLGLAIAKSIVELEGGTMQIIIDGDLFKVKIELKEEIKEL